MEYLVSSRIFLRLVFQSLILLAFVWCIEENKPEIYLAPRNFNPHPSAASYIAGESNTAGPVLFPGPPTNADSFLNGNVLNEERKFNHPVDNHPYSRVANKNKFLRRFKSKSAAGVNPGAYSSALAALSKHGVKVLAESPESPELQQGPDYGRAKNYEFSYKVIDRLTGDDFSHTQSQNSRSTNGEYRVKLPDGRLQIVSYIADVNGYKADVKYTENEPNIQIESAPAKNQIQPILPGNPYPQYNTIIGPKPLFDPASQLFRDNDYAGIFIRAPPPTPDITRRNPAGFGRPNVRIFSNLGEFVGATPTPPPPPPPPIFLDAPSGYLLNKVHNPRFKVIQNQQDGELVYGK